LDVQKARLAGLLHDWDKGMDDEEARDRVRELGMEDEIDPVVVEQMPRVLHGITAARALGRAFPAIPADVLQAIDRHTTAAVDMSPLDMALYIADAIEPNRQYGNIDELRASVGELTLEELYFKTYEYWVFLLFERRAPLHPDTIRIWNDYTSRLHEPYLKPGKTAKAGTAKAAKKGAKPSKKGKGK
jgi:predicted HD superfamily hydrolase involved in NAD metabolism